MAITPPTPPTPPKAPVVPGARQSTGDTTNQAQTNTDTGDGSRDFGVHINITTPESKQAAATTGTDGQNTNANNNAPAAANQQNDSQESAEAVAQQARQAAVQDMLGTSDTANNKETTTEVQQDTSAFNQVGQHFSGMSYMPFLLVFLAAFITFTIKNLSKKKAGESALKLSDFHTDTSPASNPAKENSQKARGNRLNLQAGEVTIASSRNYHTANSSVVSQKSANTNTNNTNTQNNNKGSHFETRI